MATLEDLIRQKQELEKEIMEDKVLRMIRNETVTTGGTCRIIDSPQMSRQSERSAS